MNKPQFFLLAVVLLGQVNFSIAQDAPCLYDSYNELMQEQNPEVYEKALREQKSKVANWIHEYRNSTNKTEATVTIPVVFHVLYNTSTQNISDARIQSQVAALNRDFQYQNPDKANIPAMFSSIAGPTQFEFCLASVDPNGNQTSGIIRKSISKTSYNPINQNELHMMKYGDQGGSEGWDRNSYLNIWVCNLSNSILGYFTGPVSVVTQPSLYREDGVVLHYGVVGQGAGTLSKYNMGRNGVHEVGHWLGLDHIWGRCGINQNCCGLDDGVEDTPNQQMDSKNCPIGNQVSCGSSDMYMNYMDYSSDGCRHMFSKGQAELMLATFNIYRSDFLYSAGCGATPPADAGILTINRPTGTSVDCSSQISPLVRLKNYAVPDLTSVDILYQLDNGPKKTYHWTGKLSGNGVVLVTLDDISIPDGQHTFKAWTEQPNGVRDINETNDLKSNTFTASCATGIEDSHVNPINLFPNPTDGRLNLTREYASGQSSSYEIYDVRGCKVLGDNINPNWTSKSLDLTLLNPGIYFIVVHESGIERCHRFVKK